MTSCLAVKRRMKKTNSHGSKRKTYKPSGNVFLLPTGSFGCPFSTHRSVDLGLLLTCYMFEILYTPYIHVTCFCREVKIDIIDIIHETN